MLADMADAAAPAPGGAAGETAAAAITASFRCKPALKPFVFVLQAYLLPCKVSIV